MKTKPARKPALLAPRTRPVSPNDKVYSLCEAVADLSAMFSSPKYAPEVPDDSRETVRLVIEWAQAFEKKHAKTVWGVTSKAGEYMEEIEKWFHSSYRAWLDGATDTQPHPQAFRRPFNPLPALRAAQHALNSIPNTKLTAFRNSYAVAGMVEHAIQNLT